MKITLAERIASIVAAFEAGCVIVEHGGFDEPGVTHTFYARDPTDSVNMGRPRPMTCDEHMGL